LHVGSVRTALFNWLYARRWGGQFLVRIEDTDKERSTQENVASVFRILKWLSIDYDENPVIQSANLSRHRDIALSLVDRGLAYLCFCSLEELSRKKELALSVGQAYKYDRFCRDSPVTKESPFVVRLKCPTDGKTVLRDLVQGAVVVDNGQLDDFVLLRSDGTPTYMLSVVVDDHDSGVTHVIRGDDHLTNTFKQIQIYEACGWAMPEFGHIPLIYGPDGAKLSKRHGAVSAEDFRSLGILPEALVNYLLKLGWSHGDDEIISVDKAVEWFDIKDVGKSPSRFDVVKLQNLNSFYMREKDNESLFVSLLPFLSSDYGNITDEGMLLVKKGLSSLKQRSKTLGDLSKNCDFFIKRPGFSGECSKFATKKHKDLLKELVDILTIIDDFVEQTIASVVRNFAERRSVRLVEIAQGLRSSLTGRLVSPSVFEIMEILGKTESLLRINLFVNTNF
jgi:glutamyl-tRNA synthetase